MITQYFSLFSITEGNKKAFIVFHLGCASLLGLSQEVSEIRRERRHSFVLCQQTQGALVQIRNQPDKKSQLQSTHEDWRSHIKYQGAVNWNIPVSEKEKIAGNCEMRNTKNSLKLILQNLHRKIHTVVYLSQVASLQNFCKCEQKCT